MYGCVYRIHAREVRLVADNSFSLKAMFTHPTDDYDFIMHLDGGVLPRYFQNIAVDTNILSRRGKYANMTREDQDATVRPGFDPARLLFKDLQVCIIVVCSEWFLRMLTFALSGYTHILSRFSMTRSVETGSALSGTRL